MGLSATLAEIRDQADAASSQTFLLTVNADGHPHCLPTPVSWADDEIVVRAPSKWAASEAGGHRHVSLLWPPALAGGYSLIVDGVARAAESEQNLRIRPTRAVLHRGGPASEESGSPCASDCIPVWPK